MSRKFESQLDEYVYRASLEGGCDEEAGWVTEGAWYGLMRDGSTIFVDHDPDVEEIDNEENREKLRSCAGVIISEDPYGFVSVTYYEDSSTLENEWATIVSELAKESE